VKVQSDSIHVDYYDTLSEDEIVCQHGIHRRLDSSALGATRLVQCILTPLRATAAASSSRVHPCPSSSPYTRRAPGTVQRWQRPARKACENVWRTRVTSPTAVDPVPTSAADCFHVVDPRRHGRGPARRHRASRRASGGRQRDGNGGRDDGGTVSF